MIAQLPTPPDDCFSKYAVLILGWIIVTGCFGLFTYLWGKKNSIFTEKHRAQNAARAEIDRFLAESEVTTDLRPLLKDSQSRLEPFVFAVSGQLSCERHRTRIKTEWADYKKLHEGAFPAGLMSLDSAGQTETRKRLSQPLNRLRYEIDAA